MLHRRVLRAANELDESPQGADAAHRPAAQGDQVRELAQDEDEDEDEVVEDSATDEVWAWSGDEDFDSDEDEMFWQRPLKERARLREARLRRLYTQRLRETTEDGLPWVEEPMTGFKLGYGSDSEEEEPPYDDVEDAELIARVGDWLDMTWEERRQVVEEHEGPTDHELFRACCRVGRGRARALLDMLPRLLEEQFPFSKRDFTCMFMALHRANREQYYTKLRSIMETHPTGLLNPHETHKVYLQALVEFPAPRLALAEAVLAVMPTDPQVLRVAFDIMRKNVFGVSYPRKALLRRVRADGSDEDEDNQDAMYAVDEVLSLGEPFAPEVALELIDGFQPRVNPDIVGLVPFLLMEGSRLVKRVDGDAVKELAERGSGLALEQSVDDFIKLGATAMKKSRLSAEREAQKREERKHSEYLKRLKKEGRTDELRELKRREHSESWRAARLYEGRRLNWAKQSFLRLDKRRAMWLEKRMQGSENAEGDSPASPLLQFVDGVDMDNVDSDSLAAQVAQQVLLQCVAQPTPSGDSVMKWWNACLPGHQMTAVDTLTVDQLVLAVRAASRSPDSPEALIQVLQRVVPVFPPHPNARLAAWTPPADLLLTHLPHELKWKEMSTRQLGLLLRYCHYMQLCVPQKLVTRFLQVNPPVPQKGRSRERNDTKFDYANAPGVVRLLLACQYVEKEAETVQMMVDAAGRTGTKGLASVRALAGECMSPERSGWREKRRRELDELDDDDVGDVEEFEQGVLHTRYVPSSHDLKVLKTRCLKHAERGRLTKALQYMRELEPIVDQVPVTLARKIKHEVIEALARRSLTKPMAVLHNSKTLQHFPSTSAIVLDACGFGKDLESLELVWDHITAPMYETLHDGSQRRTSYFVHGNLRISAVEAFFRCRAPLRAVETALDAVEFVDAGKPAARVPLLKLAKTVMSALVVDDSSPPALRGEVNDFNGVLQSVGGDDWASERKRSSGSDADLAAGLKMHFQSVLQRAVEHLREVDTAERERREARRLHYEAERQRMEEQAKEEARMRALEQKREQQREQRRVAPRQRRLAALQRQRRLRGMRRT